MPETTQGRVIESYIEEDDDHDYTAIVRYEYRVDGKLYTGDNLKPSWGRSYTGTPGPQQKIVDRYPPGLTLPVYYNPRNPEKAWLEKGTPAGVQNAMLMIILAAVVVVIIVILFTTIFV